eukprot:11112208-Alexandrium_andersonii.AAC.1
MDSLEPNLVHWEMRWTHEYRVRPSQRIYFIKEGPTLTKTLSAAICDSPTRPRCQHSEQPR